MISRMGLRNEFKFVRVFWFVSFFIHFKFSPLGFGLTFYGKKIR